MIILLGLNTCVRYATIHGKTICWKPVGSLLSLVIREHRLEKKPLKSSAFSLKFIMKRFL